MSEEYPLLKKLTEKFKHGDLNVSHDPKNVKYLEPINANFMEKEIITFKRLGQVRAVVVKENEKDVRRFQGMTGEMFQDNKSFPEDVGHLGIIMSDVYDPYLYIQIGKEKAIVAPMYFMKDAFSFALEHLSERMELRLFYEEYKRQHGDISLEDFYNNILELEENIKLSLKELEEKFLSKELS